MLTSLELRDLLDALRLGPEPFTRMVALSRGVDWRPDGLIALSSAEAAEIEAEALRRFAEPERRAA